MPPRPPQTLAERVGRPVDARSHGLVGGLISGKLGNNHFEIGYSSDARSKCHEMYCLCGDTTIVPSQLRIGKRAPTVNGTSTRVIWYHPRCIFRTFERANRTSTTVDSVDDLNGFYDIMPEDQQLVAQHVKDWAAKKLTARTNGKERRQTRQQTTSLDEGELVALDRRKRKRQQKVIPTAHAQTDFPDEVHKRDLKRQLLARIAPVARNEENTHVIAPSSSSCNARASAWSSSYSSSSEDEFEEEDNVAGSIAHIVHREQTGRCITSELRACVTSGHGRAQPARDAVLAADMHASAEWHLPQSPASSTAANAMPSSASKPKPELDSFRFSDGIAWILEDEMQSRPALSASSSALLNQLDYLMENDSSCTPSTFPNCHAPGHALPPSPEDETGFYASAAGFWFKAEWTKDKVVPCLASNAVGARS